MESSTAGAKTTATKTPTTMATTPMTPTTTSARQQSHQRRSWWFMAVSAASAIAAVVFVVTSTTTTTSTRNGSVSVSASVSNNNNNNNNKRDLRRKDYRKDQWKSIKKLVKSSPSSSSSSSSNPDFDDLEGNDIDNENFVPNNEEEMVQQLMERMKPRTEGIIPHQPKQFYLLHHMKTGGTSANHLISCALGRFADSSPKKFRPAFYRLSECSGRRYTECLSQEKNRCREGIASSETMSYCSPLHAVHQFGWEQADAITVLRDPVDRVWSMFRFQTKGCFKCKPLTEIYQHIDAGTAASELGMSQLCIDQLLNHMTRNTLSNLEEEMTPSEQLENALENIQHAFTVVGLTSNMDESVKMFRHAFPWMHHTVPGSSTTCDMKHDNSSPKNNRCGADGKSHWALPDHPDDETRQVILEHNQMDVKLYEAAVAQFELQKRAIHNWAQKESG